jgi:hypothetical protein
MTNKQPDQQYEIGMVGLGSWDAISYLTWRTMVFRWRVTTKIPLRLQPYVKSYAWRPKHECRFLG